MSLNKRYLDIKEKELFFNFFTDKNKIAIISHEDPDGDAIASLSSIYFFCKINSINSEIFLYNLPPFIDYNKWNLNINPISNLKQENFDGIIFVDTPSISRSGLSIDTDIKIPSLNIDHHIDNRFFCEFNIVAPGFCSSSEIIYDLINDSDFYNINIINKENFNPLFLNLLESILMGILFDTYYFNTENVDHILLQRASELHKLTGSMHKLKNILFKNQSPMIYKFWGYILTNISLYYNNQLVIAKVDRKIFEKFENEYPDFSRSVATEGFINHLMSLRNVSLSIFIREMQNEIKVSIRSSIKVASILANKFGGGGHENASAFKIKRDKNFDIYELEKKILDIIDQEGFFN
ncbi:MAG: DHH family phosphoesterase [Exilispira sp.]